jgi:hypothetical protein
MKKHRFTLILAGIGELTPEIADALYEATDGDLELNQRGGVAFAELQKPARTLQDAITVSIRAIEKAAVGVKVVRVESETANVIAKINAELLGTIGS